MPCRRSGCRRSPRQDPSPPSRAGPWPPRGSDHRRRIPWATPARSSRARSGSVEVVGVESQSNARFEFFGSIQKYVPPAPPQLTSPTEPASGDPLAKVAIGGEADIDRAVEAARAALGGAWAKTPPTELTWALIIYGFIAAVLPVWLLLAPRDYLSTFLKIGTIVGLAIGIVIVAPELKMPATTKFIDGTGPVWSGSLFPFLFITIACGAVSGFHALISSGTTPKMIENETQARYIGYGGMLMESFVAIMALVAACVIEPGIYYAMNSPAALIGRDATPTRDFVACRQVRLRSQNTDG